MSSASPSTLLIKIAPGGDKVSVPFPSPANEFTVAQLKEAIEEQSKIPVAEQRLIYKGYVLRDARTVESYTITDGQTILLVRGKRGGEKEQHGTQAEAGETQENNDSASATSATSTSPSPSSSTSPAPSSSSSSPSSAAANPWASLFGGAAAAPAAPAASAAAANPFAALMGGGMGGMGGGMDFASMQQQMMSNPEMMRSMMNSPMMQCKTEKHQPSRHNSTDHRVHCTNLCLISFFLQLFLTILS